MDGESKKKFITLFGVPMYYIGTYIPIMRTSMSFFFKKQFSESCLRKIWI